MEVINISEGVEKIEMLEAIGLDVPVISKIATKLKNAGVSLEGRLYTVDGVKEAVIKLLGGRSK